MRTPRRIEVLYSSENDTLFYADILLNEDEKTVHDAIVHSGVLDRFDIDLERQPVGLFGQKVPLNHPLEPFDRVEIYRPLKVDPKAQRLKRASLESKAK